MDEFTKDQQEQINVLVDAKIQMAVGWRDNHLSRERELVQGYYQGDLPKRQSKGNASFVSKDVYDAVEAMKAQLLETFAAGYDIIKFAPETQADVEAARIATEYTNYVLFRQNDGFRIFNDAIHDGLTSRAGVAKVYWDECWEYPEETFEGLHPDAAEGLAVQDDVHELDATLDEATGTYKGTLKRKLDKGRVKIEIVAPEEFSVEAQAKDLSKSYFICHRTVKMLGELVEMGIPKAKLDKIEWGNEETLQNSPEVLARFKQIDDGYRLNASGENEADVKRILLYEAYLPVNFKDNEEGPKYLKVLRAGSVTLDIQEVDDHPFTAFVPLPIPHAFFGNNFAKNVVPTQNARTILTRSILDHSAITNNPRYMVTKGGLTNPRELLDNRLGGIVNVTRPDAVIPLPQANLNPYVFTTLEMLKANAEETTGISSLSQGMNKDAISTQNSADLVDNLVTLSQTRQKIIARQFAYGFVIPLFNKIYDAVLKNCKQEEIVELTGSFVPVDPSKWKNRKTAVVSLTLGYGEQEKEAQKYVMLLKMAQESPELKKMMGIKGLYNATGTILKLSNIKNINDYITPPEKIEPDKPNPMAVQHMKNETDKAQATLMTAQANVKKVENHVQLELLKKQMDQMQQQFNNMMAQHESDRKDADIANKIDVAQREITIEENAPDEDKNVIVSAR